MKVVMLLEEVENLEFNHVESSYKRCLHMLKSAEMMELDIMKGSMPSPMKIGNISNINLDCLAPISPDYLNKNSNSLSKDDGEEE